MGLAHKLVEAAREAGADAVKFQAFITEELVTSRAKKANYQTETTGGGDQFDMLKALELTSGQQAELKAHCDDAGLAYLCTPYDLPSIDMLDRLGVDAYKVASTDANNIPFLRDLASRGKSVILSTGMATLAEVEASVAEICKCRPEPWLALLQCTSEYPAPLEESNLLAMETLRRAFGKLVGFSDHTEGVGASPLAVVMGAQIIEKHLTLDRKMKGPDHRASLDPVCFTELVRAVRGAEAAMGDGIKIPVASEVPNKVRMRKSLVARRAVKSGSRLAPDDLTFKRPGDGLEPAWYDRVIGKRVARDIACDEQLDLGCIEW